MSGGKLTAKQVREAIEANSWAETSTIREFNDSSWQAIADELNAATGAGECRVVKSETCGQMWVYCHEFSCDCGQRNLFTISSEPPKHCPNCGARVVKR